MRMTNKKPSVPGWYYYQRRTTDKKYPLRVLRVFHDPEFPEELCVTGKFYEEPSDNSGRFLRDISEDNEQFWSEAPLPEPVFPEE